MAPFGNLEPMSDPRGYLTDEQLERFLEQLYRQDLSHRMLFLTLAYTGRRISEVVRGPWKDLQNQYGIRARDIDFEANVITWNILKKRPRKRADILAGVPKSEPVRKTLPTRKQLIKMLGDYIKSRHIKPDSLDEMEMSRKCPIYGGKGIENVELGEVCYHCLRCTSCQKLKSTSWATSDRC